MLRYGIHFPSVNLAVAPGLGFSEQFGEFARRISNTDRGSHISQNVHLQLDVKQFHGILFHQNTKFRAFLNQEFRLFPRPTDERPLFIVPHIQINCSSRRLRVAEPKLQQIQWYLCKGPSDTKRMTKPFRGGVDTCNFSLLHHPLDDSPTCGPRERP